MVTTFVTVPPTVYDVHYWLFGMFVTMAVAAFVAGIVGSKTDVPVASYTFIILTMIGMFAGSLIALAMNTIPWIVSAMIFLALVILFWRSRS